MKPQETPNPFFYGFWFAVPIVALMWGVACLLAYLLSKLF
jgi:hypothetical protein